jgi:hypothetical protein
MVEVPANVVLFAIAARQASEMEQNGDMARK